MPRLSKDQISSLKEEYKSGTKPSALLSKYNITKHALYHHVGKKATNDAVEATATEYATKENNAALYQNSVTREDPIIDFEQLPERAQTVHTPSRANDNIFSVFNIDNDESDPFHPDNILSQTTDKATAKADKPSSWNMSIFNSTKKLFQDEKKSPEEIKKQGEQERLKLVYQVRLYLYTFREEDNLFLALGVDRDDKKINKYIQDLYKRKVPKLE